MPSNTINTRIKLKYDTLSNWIQSNFIPLEGEVCIAEIPSGTSSTGLTPPAIGMKVGDGTHIFNQLDWIQATAGDVYSWAKHSSVVNDETRVALTTLIQQANILYQIVQGTGANAWKFYLQSSSNGGISYSNVGNDPFLDLNTFLSSFLETEIVEDSNDNDYNAASTTTVPTVSAVVDYVNEKVSSLTGVLHFKGTTTTQMSDGLTTAAVTINNESYTPVEGDVVLYNNAEFVWTGTLWELLGDEGSYAVKGSIIKSDLSSALQNELDSKLEGIQIPTTPGGLIYSNLTVSNKKITLEKIAHTGSIYDVVETSTKQSYNSTSQEYEDVSCLIFDCGSATQIIEYIPSQEEPNNGGE